jgi:hypothetical protein
MMAAIPVVGASGTLDEPPAATAGLRRCQTPALVDVKERTVKPA